MKNRLIYAVSMTAVAAGLLIACGNGDDDDTTASADAGTDSSVTQDASTQKDAAPAADSSTTPDSSTATDSGPATDAGTDAATDAGPPTFTAVYDQILSGICATCHVSGSGATGGKLVMDSYDDAYANLVGVTSTGEACGGDGLKRVVAGSSATSLLWEKVSGNETCGSRMPLNNTPLTQADQDLIAAWINAGALKN